MPEVTIHGHRLAYREAGEPGGEAVLLVHGITNSSATWAPITTRLAAHGLHVLAPDLPGHGHSQRQRGDHSLGAHASVLRDFLGILDVEPVTIVGHSLGGGVVMQFTYQFPEIVSRMVLVSSGGLGREVSLGIRAATLPFAEQVMGLGATKPVTRTAGLVGGALGRLGVKPGGDFGEIMEGLASLSDRERREAFVRTARSVVTPGGQRVAATDKLYLAAAVPTLFVTGDRDHVIPADHTRAAAKIAPGSRLEVFAGSGHFPHLDDPDRFTALLAEFIDGTEPAALTREEARKLLLTGPPPPA